MLGVELWDPEGCIIQEPGWFAPAIGFVPSGAPAARPGKEEGKWSRLAQAEKSVGILA